MVIHSISGCAFSFTHSFFLSTLFICLLFLFTQLKLCFHVDFFLLFFFSFFFRGVVLPDFQVMCDPRRTRGEYVRRRVEEAAMNHPPGSPDPVILVTGGYDHGIRFWHAYSGVCCRTVQFTDSVSFF